MTVDPSIEPVSFHKTTVACDLRPLPGGVLHGARMNGQE
jgi:hypothetical protein